jgi:ATP-dependent exoDNAse (exonuclease V) beta subunit
MRDAVRTDTAPQFLSRLYDGLGIKEYFLAAGDLGAVDDLERLREEARRLFRNEEALTVRIFVDWLRTQIQHNSPISADDMYSPATTSVRVMTIHRAKGREFPVVIIPGMFRGLYFEGKEPWYVIDEQGGIDLLLPTRSGVATCSPHWPRELAEHRQAELREEMRLLYVAVTRAVHQVVFAGDPQRSNGPTSPYYSWADEVLRVYSRIPGALAIP